MRMTSNEELLNGNKSSTNTTTGLKLQRRTCERSRINKESLKRRLETLLTKTQKLAKSLFKKCKTVNLSSKLLKFQQRN